MATKAIAGILIVAGLIGGDIGGQIEIGTLAFGARVAVIILGVFLLYSEIGDHEPLMRRGVIGLGAVFTIIVALDERQPSSGVIPAEMIKASASSELPRAGNTTYGAANTIDGRIDTAWNDGVRPHEKGPEDEWLRYSFDEEVQLEEIRLRNGYQRLRLWEKNHRLHKIEVQTDSRTFEVVLKDVRDVQTISKKFGRTKFVKVTIKEIFSGNATDFEPDVALSEVEFIGKR